MVIGVYLDANHSGNMFNMRSCTGIIIYVNNSLTIWFNKRQNILGSSTFGLEHIALSIATEMVEALRYKLRKNGIPIDGLDEVVFDNQLVVKNSITPTSTLNKRHHAIFYHQFG